MTFKVSDNQYGRPHLATAALLYFFAIFLAAHILRVNCFKIARDRPKQLMYTIFSIKRIIFCRLYTDCPGGRTDAVARHVSFPQITCLYLFFCTGWRSLSGSCRQRAESFKSALLSHGAPPGATKRHYSRGRLVHSQMFIV